MSWLWCAVSAGLLLTAGVAYTRGVTDKQAEWDRAVLKERAGQDAALQAAAKAIARIEVKSEKHIAPVVTEVRTNTVYRECQHSADSLRNLNALIVGDEPGVSSEGGMPEGNATH